MQKVIDQFSSPLLRLISLGFLGAALSTQAIPHSCGRGSSAPCLVSDSACELSMHLYDLYDFDTPRHTLSHKWT